MQSKIHDANYSIALGEVESWIDSPEGIAQAHFEDMEAFLQKHSSDPVKPENVLTRGLPWGGLHEALTGRKLAAGVVFDTPAESLKAAATAGPRDSNAAMVPSAVQLWHEVHVKCNGNRSMLLRKETVSD